MNVEDFSLQARARVHAALGDPSRLAIVDALTVGDASAGEIGRSLAMPTNRPGRQSRTAGPDRD
jgi:hypothetical protein